MIFLEKHIMHCSEGIDWDIAYLFKVFKNSFCCLVFRHCFFVSVSVIACGCNSQFEEVITYH